MQPKYFIKFNGVLETTDYKQFENTKMYDCKVDGFDQPITVHADYLYDDKRNALSKLIRELEHDLSRAKMYLNEELRRERE